MKKLTLRDARKVLSVVDYGLSMGIGTPTPGQMCIEAAVCYALGLPHGDDPQCVAPTVKWYKIAINDSEWSSKAARARGMRRVAIAQLGSDQIDERRFAEIVARLTIQRILPVALRAVARRADEQYKTKLREAAVRCEMDAAADSARAAADSARAAAADAAADSARAARAARAAAADAAAAAAADTAAAAAATYAANATRLIASIRGVNADRVLTMAAEIAVEALQECGSQGCRWLWLCDE
jgi:hypothetical protein